MKPKRLKQEEIESLKSKSISLWKAGYTTRQISEIIKVRTHAWVHNVVKNTPVDNLTIDKD